MSITMVKYVANFENICSFRRIGFRLITRRNFQALFCKTHFNWIEIHFWLPWFHHCHVYCQFIKGYLKWKFCTNAAYVRTIWLRFKNKRMKWFILLLSEDLNINRIAVAAHKYAPIQQRKAVLALFLPFGLAYVYTLLTKTTAESLFAHNIILPDSRKALFVYTICLLGTSRNSKTVYQNENYDLSL